MARFILIRLATAAGTLFAVSILVFAATAVLPGDVARSVLGRDATPESLAVVRERLHLNESPFAQYTHWFFGIIRGNPGVSVAASSTVVLANEDPHKAKGVPVSHLLGERLRNTLVLMLVTSTLLVPLSLLLGTYAAMHRDGLLDRLIGMTTLAVISVPDFVVATVLVFVFSLAWPILPAVSLVDPSRSLFAQPSVLVLPVLTLLASMLAQTTRMVRAGVLQVLEADYVQMARLKGLPVRLIWSRYVLRNALGASVQVFAINIAWLFGGIIIVEAVFQYPGIGLGLYQAISTRDVPVIQAIALIIAAAYVLINMVADILTVLITPKLRTAL